MNDIFAPAHDSLAGGHWIWDDATAKASFDITVKLFGKDGRISRQQWMNSMVPYVRYVLPFCEEKNV